MNMATIIIEGNLYIQICSDVERVNREIKPKLLSERNIWANT
jgi:hypothetical protein